MVIEPGVRRCMSSDGPRAQWFAKLSADETTRKWLQVTVTDVYLSTLMYIRVTSTLNLFVVQCVVLFDLRLDLQVREQHATSLISNPSVYQYKDTSIFDFIRIYPPIHYSFSPIIQ
jgi:hypothetical protein